MTNRHLKRHSTSLIIREMQIKTTVRYNFTPVRMTIINQQTSIGEDVEQRKASCPVGGNGSWCSHCGKQYGISSKS